MASQNRASHLSYDYFSSRGMSPKPMLYTLRVTTPGPLGQWKRNRTSSPTSLRGSPKNNQLSSSQPLPFHQTQFEDVAEEEEGDRLLLPDELASLRVTSGSPINRYRTASPASSRLPTVIGGSFHPARGSMSRSMGIPQPSLSPAAYEAMQSPPMTEEDYEEYLFWQETAKQQYLFANKRRLDAPKYKALSFRKTFEPTFGHYKVPSINTRNYARPQPQAI